MSSIHLYIWLPAGRHTVLFVGFSKFEGLPSTQTFKDRNFARCSGNIPCFPSWDTYTKKVRKAHLQFLCTGITEKTYYGMELLLLWRNPWSWGILNSLDTQLIFTRSEYSTRSE